MRLVFSRNRGAQLDLLLRSFERYAPPEETVVLYRATSLDFLAGYALTQERHQGVDWRVEDGDFHDALAFVLEHVAEETVTFLVDDDVLYRPIGKSPQTVLRTDTDVLTFSLRLSRDGLAYPRAGAYPVWDWTNLDPHDHGYPGSLDGHTFRTSDLHRMLDGQTIDNPLILETVLARRVHLLSEERPLMACYPQQCLVGVPVNSVADQARTAGQSFPQPAEALNERYLRGDRINLDALDFSGVDGCLHEVAYVWEQAA